MTELSEKAIGRLNASWNSVEKLSELFEPLLSTSQLDFSPLHVCSWTYPLHVRCIKGLHFGCFLYHCRGIRDCGS